MVVEPAGEQHQTSHDQSANCGAVELIGVCNTCAAPHLEQTRGDLNPVEPASHVCIQDFLTYDRPDYLCTGLNT